MVQTTGLDWTIEPTPATYGKRSTYSAPRSGASPPLRAAPPRDTWVGVLPALTPPGGGRRWWSLVPPAPVRTDTPSGRRNDRRSRPTGRSPRPGPSAAPVAGPWSGADR